MDIKFKSNIGIALTILLGIAMMIIGVLLITIENEVAAGLIIIASGIAFIMTMGGFLLE